MLDMNVTLHFQVYELASSLRLLNCRLIDIIDFGEKKKTNNAY